MKFNQQPKDLQNLIITYLDPVTYSILNTLHKDFTIVRYEKIYHDELIKHINTKFSEDNFRFGNKKKKSDIIKLCLVDVLNLFKKLEIFQAITYNGGDVIKDTLKLYHDAKSKNIITIVVKLLKNFHIYNLNDNTYFIKISHGIFYINNIDGVLLFEDYKFNGTPRIHDTIHKITLVTPFWSLLQEIMKWMVVYSDSFS